MEASAEKIGPPSRELLLLEARAIWELGAFFASIPWLRMAPQGDGHPVLVMPGLMASDLSTRPMRTFLADRGYAPHGWRLGRNHGHNRLIDFSEERVDELCQRHGRKVSLIGWSLGGVFAREVARRRPEQVRLVITLGSPFTGPAKASNAWRLYEATSGHRVDDELHWRMKRHLPPPVPTTSIFSRTDGVVAWQCSIEREGPLTENIEVYGSHCGLGHHPAALYAIADRLGQPEGQWRRFDRSGLKRLIYPDPQRAEAVSA